MNTEELLKEAKKLQEQLVKYRRELHQKAGCGFDIQDTLDFVKARLEEIGLEAKQCGKAGLTATIGKGGKTFLLRADMDGLPISEQTGLPYAAQNGKMHACGHDMHTTMLLGAAKLLKEREAELNGRVKLMFEPAEEIFEGAKDMIASGVLNEPKVDGAMMIHVMAGLPIAAGTVLVSAPGVSAPAADTFEITVQGKGCHGAMPNTGIDPVLVSAHILLAIETIQTRELGAGEKATLTFGTIHGGNAANAIPDKVVLGGSIRTFDEDTRTFVKRRLEEVALSTAKTFRAEAAVTFKSGCPTLQNDGALSEEVCGYMKELLGKKAISVAEMAKNGVKSGGAAGSEDFAYITHQVPSVMLALAAGQPKNGYAYPQHHPKVSFDEGVLSVGSAVYAYAAMRWLETHGK
jgi:hippurate hydrolase